MESKGAGALAGAAHVGGIVTNVLGVDGTGRAVPHVRDGGVPPT